MSIKVNLEFVKESKEILDGIERLTRLVGNLEINNIEIFQEYDKTKARVIYKSQDIDYNTNYFTCQIHKGTLEHYFDVDLGWSAGNIYDNVGDFGWTNDQVLYLKYGNQNLYIVEKEGIFDEVGTTFSETELREWFNEYYSCDPTLENYEFEDWLKVTVKNGYIKMYLLFDVQRDEEYIDKLFGGN